MRATQPSLLLPPIIADWFARRGWRPHPHQLAVLAAAEAGQSVLLIAPTGGGKTLAGFLPSLVELAEAPRPGMHTLYVSPLKALAVDIHRNLAEPVAEMALPLRLETRTGDTPHSKRERQRRDPPHFLMTTPESLALLLSYPDAGSMFAGLRAVIVDEIHALAGGKRGDLLALGLARLARLAPTARRVGLSATVAWPEELARWLGSGGLAVKRITGKPGAKPEVEILDIDERLPWAGHMALYALDKVYAAIKRQRTTLLFVNTRAQAELVFQALWRLNEDNLPIGLHHGSLAAEQRRKVEAAMAAGRLRAVVATSSLDLGIDWGAVDLVVHIGAPKGVSRLTQRIGRANHRLDEPSRALLVPANRFEMLECRAAADAVDAGDLDGDPPRPGGLDVLAQHLLGMACSAPFTADAMFAEVAAAAPYRGLSRRDFDDVLRFVVDGGYALRAYDRWKKLFEDSEGRFHIVSDAIAHRYRMNIGTIVEADMLRVRLGRGKLLGEVEEWFAQGLTPGDTFMFAGQMLRFEGIRELELRVSRATDGAEPKVPTYEGGRLPLTTHLAERVRGLLSRPANWKSFPAPVHEWLAAQRDRSFLPDAKGLLIETFPRGPHHYLVAYCFEGRNAHQTLGMLLTRRMERAGLKPLGFVATDYVLAVWSLEPARDLDALFDQDMLGDDLEAWMMESSMLRRSFRNVAIIAGLIERKYPGQEKSGRQVTFNSDLIYDVLRKHQPDHILLRATYADAATGLTDVKRLGDMLARVKGRIRHRALKGVSPLAIPVLLEIGRESVHGSAEDHLLKEATSELLIEAGLAQANPSPLEGEEGNAERRRGISGGGSRRASATPPARSQPAAARPLPLKGGGDLDYFLMSVPTTMPDATDTFTIPIRLAGAELFAEAHGSLWWPAERTLIVADLHFEKGSSFAMRGTLLPPYDTAETLLRLGDATARRELRRVICLGDSFHDRHGPARLGRDDAARLRRLTDSCDWVWINGNHDPVLPDEIGGRVVADEFRLGPLSFRHIARDDAAPGEISGHFHPRAAIRVRGRRLAGPCFIHDRTRLVMPAFGAFTGGLDIADAALRRLFAAAPSVHLLVRRRLVTLTPVPSI